MIKQKNNGVYLSRFGGLNIVKQKNNYGGNFYHSAPEKYGFYAFIFPYVEIFLAASTKSKEINERTYKKFKAVDGYIWTHLKPKKQSEIIAIKNSWYKIHVSSLPGAISKNYVQEAAFLSKDFGYKNRFNPFSMITKDHLEVFISRETKIE